MSNKQKLFLLAVAWTLRKVGFCPSNGNLAAHEWNKTKPESNVFDTKTKFSLK